MESKISRTEFARLVAKYNRPASEVGTELAKRGIHIEGEDQYRIDEPKSPIRSTFMQRLLGESPAQNFGQANVGSAGQTLSSGSGIKENISRIPEDISKFGQSALPFAGSMVGGALGLPAAPATMGLSVVGGAAAGRSIGEIGAQQIESLLGGEESIGEVAGRAMAGDESAQEQFAEQSKSIGKQALIGGAEGVADVLLMGAGRLIGKAVKPFKNQVDDVAVKLFAKHGVQPPVSAVSKSEFLKQGEAIAAKGMTGKSVQEVIEKATQDVTNIGDSLVTKIGGADDIMIAGKEILEGAKAYESSWRSAKNVLYKKSDDLISGRASTLTKGEFINVEATKSALDDILSSKRGAKKVLGDFVETSKLEAFRKNLDKKLSVKALSDTLDEINKMVPFGSKVDTGDVAALKKVAATLSNDLDNHIALVDPEIGKALAAADDFYSEGINLLNSQVGNTIRRLADSPEKIANAVIKNSSPSDTKRLIQLIGSTEDGAMRLNDVRSAILRDFIEKSKNTQGVIMGKTFFNQVNKMGTTLDELYTPNIAQGIREVAKMANALDAGQAAAKGSQTAFLTKLIAFSTALASSPINPSGIPIAISIAAQDVTFSKIFSTEWGRKLLTEGIQTAFPQAASQIMRGVGSAAIRGVGSAISE